MILGILAFGFLSVVSRFPSCRWLFIGERELGAGEERLCILFSNLNRSLAIIFFLFWLVHGYAGVYANIAVGCLSAVLLLQFVYRWVRGCWPRMGGD